MNKVKRFSSFARRTNFKIPMDSSEDDIILGTPPPNENEGDEDPRKKQKVNKKVEENADSIMAADGNQEETLVLFNRLINAKIDDKVALDSKIILSRSEHTVVAHLKDLIKKKITEHDKLSKSMDLQKQKIQNMKTKFDKEIIPKNLVFKPKNLYFPGTTSDEKRTQISEKIEKQFFQTSKAAFQDLIDEYESCLHADNTKCFSIKNNLDFMVSTIDSYNLDADGHKRVISAASAAYNEMWSIHNNKLQRAKIEKAAAEKAKMSSQDTVDAKAEEMLSSKQTKLISSIATDAVTKLVEKKQAETAKQLKEIKTLLSNLQGSHKVQQGPQKTNNGKSSSSLRSQTGSSKNTRPKGKDNNVNSTTTTDSSGKRGGKGSYRGHRGRGLKGRGRGKGRGF